MSNLPPGVSLNDPHIVGYTTSVCPHCGRGIELIDGEWIDPEATGDDSGRETCDRLWPLAALAARPLCGAPQRLIEQAGRLAETEKATQ